MIWQLGGCGLPNLWVCIFLSILCDNLGCVCGLLNIYENVFSYPFCVTIWVCVCVCSLLNIYENTFPYLFCATTWGVDMALWEWIWQKKPKHIKKLLPYTLWADQINLSPNNISIFSRTYKHKRENWLELFSQQAQNKGVLTLEYSEPTSREYSVLTWEYSGPTS